MANKADVNVKNVFNDSVTVNVKCRLQDGTIDKDVDIVQNEAVTVHLPAPGVALLITLPGGMDLCDCFLKVETDVDVNAVHSRTEGNWALSIIPNDLPPDVPTTMNVTVGGTEPD